MDDWAKAIFGFICAAILITLGVSWDIWRWHAFQDITNSDISYWKWHFLYKPGK